MTPQGALTVTFPCESHSRDRDPAAPFDVVVVASSAGGINALTRVLSGLPADFPAALALVQHLSPRHRSLMAEVLSRRSPLPVEEARDGGQLVPGRVVVAPPDRHLLINADGTLSLSRAELVHFVRPSADLLFESAAASFKDRVIAVVLSGMGRDGTTGLTAVKKMGGTVIVQDEATSEFSGMPHSAIQTGHADFVLPLNEIAAALVTLVKEGSAG
jgi:two-component system chemotaxis response regulator CheB